MSNFPIIILLAGLVIALSFFALRLMVANRSLRRNMSSLQLEERRIFNFLHGLGEAFSSDQINTKNLNRLIATGAADVMDAAGAALYLAEPKLSRLLPVYLTEDCPPLVPIPEHILQHENGAVAAIASFLRLHSVPVGEGVIGSVFLTGETRLIQAGEDDLVHASLPDEVARAHSAIVAPLAYHGESLGVLVVCRTAGQPPFAAPDLELFQPIAEQSAFALYNAKIYIEANEKRRLDNDLQTAREIQSILLPAEAPSLPGFEIAGRTLPARLVSGDYFDYIRIDEDRLGIVIADVSGKGVPASLIMAMCRSVLRSHAVGNPSPAAVLKMLNRQLYPDMKEDMFISVAYIIINHRDQSLTLCRAGHDAPLLYSAADSMITKLNPRGMAIGIDSGEVFDRVCTDFSVNIESGDALVLYTDGVTEAIDHSGFEFGHGRLKESVLAAARDGASSIISRVIDDLKEFTGDQPQYDDVTLIAIKKE